MIVIEIMMFHLVTDKVITNAQFIDFTIWLFGFYFAANVASEAVKAAKSYIETRKEKVDA